MGVPRKVEDWAFHLLINLIMLHLKFSSRSRGIASGQTAEKGFSLVEVCIAVAICVIFGAAAFATNQQLLMKLRTQKETTAATMMLQERLENFRGQAWSDIANKDTTRNNILTYKAPPLPVLPPGGQYTTFSEPPLGKVSETVTVSGYVSTAGVVAADPPPDANKWVRDAGHPDGYNVQSCATLAANYNLLKVDVVVTWKGVDGRSRTREMSQIFGKGNIGQ